MISPDQYWNRYQAKIPSYGMRGTASVLNGQAVPGEIKVNEQQRRDPEPTSDRPILWMALVKIRRDCEANIGKLTARMFFNKLGQDSHPREAALLELIGCDEMRRTCATSRSSDSSVAIHCACNIYLPASLQPMCRSLEATQARE